MRINVGRIGPMAMLVGLNLRMVEVGSFPNDLREVQDSNGAGGTRARSRHVFDHGQWDGQPQPDDLASAVHPRPGGRSASSDLRCLADDDFVVIFRLGTRGMCIASSDGDNGYE